MAIECESIKHKVKIENNVKRKLEIWIFYLQTRKMGKIGSEYVKVKILPIVEDSSFSKWL